MGRHFIDELRPTRATHGQPPIGTRPATFPRPTLGDLVSLPEKLLLLVCVPPVIQAAAAPEVPCPEPIIPAPILPLANVFLSPLVPHLVVAVDEALAVELEPLGLLLLTNECTDPGE